METFLGYLVLGLVTLIGLFTAIQKFIEPINALNVSVQKLNDHIETLTKDNERQGKTLDDHEKQINDLHDRVGIVETKIDMYHKNT